MLDDLALARRAARGSGSAPPALRSRILIDVRLRAKYQEVR
jgi:hypothetical protein